ncbi:hypothetical protein COE58_22825 [Bacillus cereus]|nr:hypothetical protein COE58_22825 [Bacillus cereus]
MGRKRKDVKIHVTEIGELNCKLFAEKLVEINRRRLLNGEINLKDYAKTTEAENPSEKKE